MGKKLDQSKTLVEKCINELRRDAPKMPPGQLKARAEMFVSMCQGLKAKDVSALYDHAMALIK